MKFLIAGAGAIGGYLGARMVQTGQEVTLFARGPHLAAMQQRGLRVIDADGGFEVRPRVIGNLQEAGPTDVIILGVKAHGLTQLAPQLASLIGENTTVVSTQNGILAVLPSGRRRVHGPALERGSRGLITPLPFRFVKLSGRSPISLLRLPNPE